MLLYAVTIVNMYWRESQQQLGLAVTVLKPAKVHRLQRFDNEGLKVTLVQP